MGIGLARRERAKPQARALGIQLYTRLTISTTSFTMKKQCSTRENPMSDLNAVQQRNRELADRLIEEAQRNPQSASVGQYVGIANGQIVVVTDNLNELAHRLRQAEPDPNKTFIVEPGRDFGEVHKIWETR